MPYFNKGKEQESYDNLEDAFDYEEGENEEPLHGYNSRALSKRDRERHEVLREDEQCFNQVLKEEETAAEIARKNKPKSRKSGEEIAEESVSNTFWKSIFGGN